jgi:hypothetical protein
MKRRVICEDDLMQVIDDDGCGHDAHVIDRNDPYAALEVIARWGREFGVEPFAAILALRRYLKDEN